MISTYGCFCNYNTQQNYFIMFIVPPMYVYLISFCEDSGRCTDYLDTISDKANLNTDNCSGSMILSVPIHQQYNWWHSDTIWHWYSTCLLQVNSIVILGITTPSWTLLHSGWLLSRNCLYQCVIALEMVWFFVDFHFIRIWRCPVVGGSIIYSCAKKEQKRKGSMQWKYEN